MRRVFLMLAALAVITSVMLAGADDKKKAGILFGGNEKLMQKVSLQLYSLREQFKSGVPETLAKVKQMGFTTIEMGGTYGMPPTEFKTLLDKYGLRPVSMHAGYEKLRDDIDSVIADAKLFGVEYAGCAWIPHKGTFTADDARQAAAHFNEWGQKLAAHGIRFMYHIHGYEFQPADKGTLFDLMVQQTNPEFVTFQMDVFWVVHPGQDPVALLKKYPKRFDLLHVKDMKHGVKGDLTGQAPEDWNVIIGTGQVNWPALIRQAEKNGVKHYVIEDESPAVERQIPSSLQYLRTMKY